MAARKNRILKLKDQVDRMEIEIFESILKFMKLNEELVQPVHSSVGVSYHGGVSS